MAMSAKASDWLKPPKLYWIAQWVKDKLTKEEIANKIGISRRQLNTWEKYPIEDNTVKLGRFVVVGAGTNFPNFPSSNTPTSAHKKTLGEYMREQEESIFEIEESHFMTATGYYVEEISMNKKGQVIKTMRWIPGSEKAQQHILEVERPDKYIRKESESNDDPLLDNYSKDIEAQLEELEADEV